MFFSKWLESASVTEFLSYFVSSIEAVLLFATAATTEDYYRLLSGANAYMLPYRIALGFVVFGYLGWLLRWHLKNPKLNSKSALIVFVASVPAVTVAVYATDQLIYYWYADRSWFGVTVIVIGPPAILIVALLALIPAWLLKRLSSSARSDDANAE